LLSTQSYKARLKNDHVTNFIVVQVPVQKTPECAQHFWSQMATLRVSLTVINM